MTTLVYHKELELGGDFFMWPHPTNSGEVMFVVDDAVEQTTREVASRSREGLQVTLSKIGDAIAMITQLGMEA